MIMGSWNVDREKVMTKVRKCLALSKSATGNEAAVALRQAQVLMARYGMSEDEVELAEVVSAEARAGWGISTPRYMARLVSLIERAFGVVAVFQRVGSKTNTIQYFGIGCQPEIAAYASDVIRRQLRRDRDAYLKTLKRFKRANKIRRADLYSEAWVCAAGEAVQSFVSHASVRSLVQRAIAQRLGELSDVSVRSRRYQSRDGVAAAAGVRDGKRARLHQAAGFEPKVSLGQWS